MLALPITIAGRGWQSADHASFFIVHLHFTYEKTNRSVWIFALSVIVHLHFTYERS